MIFRCLLAGLQKRLFHLCNTLLLAFKVPISRTTTWIASFPVHVGHALTMWVPGTIYSIICVVTTRNIPWVRKLQHVTLRTLKLIKQSDWWRQDLSDATRTVAIVTCTRCISSPRTCAWKYDRLARLVSRRRYAFTACIHVHVYVQYSDIIYNIIHTVYMECRCTSNIARPLDIPSTNSVAAAYYWDMIIAVGCFLNARV